MSAEAHVPVCVRGVRVDMLHARVNACSVCALLCVRLTSSMRITQS